MFEYEGGNGKLKNAEYPSIDLSCSIEISPGERGWCVRVSAKIRAKPCCENG
ncbi:MAG: hypothetical protein H7645_10930 [Candidatus Heimdallarchaeota archaeon]|nr:hypothetical protein [Candidatus Heimdallarchaeota archaeon]